MSKIIYRYNGQEVTQEELARLMPPKPNWLEAPPMASNTYSEHDPLLSDGCGVMKSQVKEAREVIALHQIPGVAVLPDGKIRFTSRSARKKWLQVRGLCDNDAGYSD